VNWITPITDRSAADITNRTSKGFFNETDINRIEGNIAWLVYQLARFNFFTNATTVTNWYMHSLPNISDFYRIRDNILATAADVRQARPDIRFTLENMSDLQFEHLNYATVNVLEQNILILWDVITRMSTIYRQASFISGQQLFLPQRRV